MSTSTVLIKPARGDAEMALVAALFREYQAWLDVDLCFQSFEAELAALPGAYGPPAGEIWLALQRDRPIGVVGVKPLTEDGTCEMKRLWVRPAFRRSGLGRRLAVTAMAWAARQGYRCMRLDTLARLEAAVALYRTLGFVETPAYYDNPLVDVVYMQVALDSWRDDSGTIRERGCEQRRASLF